MLYKTSWMVEGRILLIESSGVGGVQDWKLIQQIAHDAIEEDGKPPQVHVIHKVLEHHEVSNQPYHVAEIRNTMRSHPLIGWIIIVTEQPDPILRFITTVVAQMLRQPLRIVPNTTEAVALLKRLDLTLDIPTISTS